MLQINLHPSNPPGFSLHFQPGWLQSPTINPSLPCASPPCRKQRTTEHAQKAKAFLQPPKQGQRAGGGGGRDGLGALHDKDRGCREEHSEEGRVQLCTLRPESEGKGPRVTCASVSWAGWLHTRLGLRQHGWRSEDWVTRPERPCPALHSGHHSPWCQSSGEKRAARQWGEQEERFGGQEGEKTGAEPEGVSG